MPKVPNFENLPLVNSPYNSRTGLNAGKYQMVAFRPGYPLQASELNEIQEQMYIQNALTTMMWANWCTFKVASTVDSTGPGWEGATPLEPSLLSLNGTVLTVKAGWYLCKMKTSGLYFWLYNNLPSTSFSLSTTQLDYYIGFAISTQGVDSAGNPILSGSFITCTQDPSLQDNASGASGFCGADRYKVEIQAVGQQSGGFSSSFVPIVKRLNDGFYFLNNIKVGTV